MIIKHLVDVGVYGCKVEFILTDNVNKEINRIYGKNEVPIDYEGSPLGVLVYTEIGRYQVIYDVANLSHNTISHEIYHATRAITYGHREIEDEEAQAWLHGYLTGELYRFLHNKKIKILHGN